MLQGRWKWELMKRVSRFLFNVSMYTNYVRADAWSGKSSKPTKFDEFWCASLHIFVWTDHSLVDLKLGIGKVETGRTRISWQSRWSMDSHVACDDVIPELRQTVGQRMFHGKYFDVLLVYKLPLPVLCGQWTPPWIGRYVCCFAFIDFSFACQIPHGHGPLESSRWAFLWAGLVLQQN